MFELSDIRLHLGYARALKAPRQYVKAEPPKKKATRRKRKPRAVAH